MTGEAPPRGENSANSARQLAEGRVVGVVAATNAASRARSTRGACGRAAPRAGSKRSSRPRWCRAQAQEMRREQAPPRLRRAPAHAVLEPCGPLGGHEHSGRTTEASAARRDLMEHATDAPRPAARRPRGEDCPMVVRARTKSVARGPLGLPRHRHAASFSQNDARGACSSLNSSSRRALRGGALP